MTDKMSVLTPHCYVCGIAVEAMFVLAAMSDNVDRVFVAHLLCSRQMESVLTLKVVT